MKLRVFLNDAKESDKKHYDFPKYNRKVIYNNDWQCLYYDVDIEFMPIEGQRIDTMFGVSVITDSIIDLEPLICPNNIFNISRIFVKQL